MLFFRTLFCEKYIVPRTTAAGKYISLYRKIRDQGYYVHSVGDGGLKGGAVVCSLMNKNENGLIAANRLSQIKED